MTAPKASDFYAIRRGWIRDAVAGVAFLAGFIGAGPFGWALMQADVNAGDMAHGLLRFLAVVVVGGVAAGLAGLVVGAGVGWAWQQMHASGRRPIPADDMDAPLAASVAKSSRPDLAYAIRYEGPPISVDVFAGLLRDCAVYSAGAEEVLPRTTNVGAWHDSTLIGIVRVLSDGRHATVTDILVHPAYRRLGVGRELMRRATALAGPSGLTVVAPRDSVRFFEKVGALRGPIALVMKV